MRLGEFRVSVQQQLNHALPDFGENLGIGFVGSSLAKSVEEFNGRHHNSPGENDCGRERVEGPYDEIRNHIGKAEESGGIV
jgi:hypothetical protein